MSVYGIRPNLPGTAGPAAGLGVQRPQPERAEQPRVDRRPGAAIPAAGVGRPQAPNAAQAPGQPVPVQAPPGTDPELWSVLSADERAFFAKVGAMGPLTYGRMMTGQQPATPPMAVGGRIDFKA
jgi:hypothetical protein